MTVLDTVGPVKVGSDLATRDVGALARDLGAWIDEHWDPDLSVSDWWNRVADGRWATPEWPERWGGRGLSVRDAGALRHVFEQRGALVPPSGVGRSMAAPTLLAHGTDDQRARYLPGIQQGTNGWCQLFSEPDAGSDLASLTTTARLVDGEWVVSGQKVWSSQAAQSDLGMLLARTESDVPRHGGISWLIVPLDQPGVIVRPLREMTGRALFNEVFLDEARCIDVVGGRGNGWAVAQTTLFAERSSLVAGGNHPVGRFAGPNGGMLDRRAGDVMADAHPERASTLSADDVVTLAASLGTVADPILRQQLARLVTDQRVAAWTTERLLAAGGARAVPALSKLGATRVVKGAAEAALALLGPAAQLAGPDGPDDGYYAHVLLFSAASSIYGGSDEIQRNILAERTLELPRDQR